MKSVLSTLVLSGLSSDALIIPAGDQFTGEG